MMHAKRTWCISLVDDAEHLAHLLGPQGSGWTLCTAFRVKGTAYLFLNDSTGENAAQEYAAVKEVGDGTFTQVESITFSWCDQAQALKNIQDVLTGEVDYLAGRSLTLHLETREQHGACPLCA
jgi:hypothetical protein